MLRKCLFVFALLGLSLSQTVQVFEAFQNSRFTSSGDGFTWSSSHNIPFAGWVTNCPGFDLFGGYSRFGYGTSLTKVFTDLPTHSEIRISMELYLLDRIDNTRDFMYIRAAGTQIKKITRTLPLAEYNSGSEYCGMEAYHDEIVQINEVVTHSSPSFELSIYDQFEGTQYERSWGIRNLKLFISSCHYSCKSCSGASTCTECTPEATVNAATKKCECNSNFYVSSIAPFTCASGAGCASSSSDGSCELEIKNFIYQVQVLSSSSLIVTDYSKFNFNVWLDRSTSFISDNCFRQINYKLFIRLQNSTLVQLTNNEYRYDNASLSTPVFEVSLLTEVLEKLYTFQVPGSNQATLKQFQIILQFIYPSNLVRREHTLSVYMYSYVEEGLTKWVQMTEDPEQTKSTCANCQQNTDLSTEYKICFDINCTQIADENSSYNTTQTIYIKIQTSSTGEISLQSMVFKSNGKLIDLTSYCVTVVSQHGYIILKLELQYLGQSDGQGTLRTEVNNNAFRHRALANGMSLNPRTFVPIKSVACTSFSSDPTSACYMAELCASKDECKQNIGLIVALSIICIVVLFETALIAYNQLKVSQDQKYLNNIHNQFKIELNCNASQKSEPKSLND